MCRTWENQTNKVSASYFQMKLKSMTRGMIKSLLEILRFDIQWWPWSKAIFRDRYWNILNSVLRKFQHDWSRYWFQGLYILTRFSPVLRYYTSWKHQKTSVFRGYSNVTLGWNGLIELRSGSRAATTSKMELFVSTVCKGFRRLPIVTKSSIFDVATALDLSVNLVQAILLFTFKISKYIRRTAIAELHLMYFTSRKINKNIVWLRSLHNSFKSWFSLFVSCQLAINY